MAGQLKIITGTVHTAGRAFVVRVEVSGAEPGDRITVRLTQTAGTGPFHAGSQPVDIIAGGQGLAEFGDVVVHGPGSVAVLIAESEVARSDEAHIQVVP